MRTRRWIRAAYRPSSAPLVPPPQAKNPGQSSAAHMNSGSTLPSAPPSEGSGSHAAATRSRPSIGEAKIRMPSPRPRSGPQTKQPG